MRSNSKMDMPRTLLYAGIAGALLMYVGDLLMFGDFANTSMSTDNLAAVMRATGGGRVLAGGAVGPLAGALYCLGFCGVGAFVRRESPRIRAAIVLLFCLAMVYGGAYHSHFPHLAFALPAEGYGVFEATGNYIRILTMGAVAPMALAGVLFLYAVLRGHTAFPRRLAILSPLPLVLFSFPLQYLPAPLFTLITAGWNNLLFVVFFFACSRATTPSPSMEEPEGGGVALSAMKAGEQGSILKLGCPPQMTERLGSLGMLPGNAVRVLRDGRTLVVECGGTFVAVSEKFAGRISVRRPGPEELES